MENSPLLTLQKNGSIRVTGKFTLTDEEGNKIDTPAEVWLCRCGRSSRKPFCDGSHRKADSPVAQPKESCD